MGMKLLRNKPIFDSLAKQCHPALKITRMKNNQIAIANNMTLIAGDSEICVYKIKRH